MQSERYDAVQGKGRHSRIYVGIEAIPVLVDDGERQACSGSCGVQSGWVVHIEIIGIGRGLRQNVCAPRPFATDEHALQRPVLLGSVGMSSDIRKEF